MNTLNHDAISLFSMGDNTPTIVEDCYTAPDECLIINTSDKKTSSSSISPAWVQARETSIRGVETGSTPSVCFGYVFKTKTKSIDLTSAIVTRVPTRQLS